MIIIAVKGKERRILKEYLEELKILEEPDLGIRENLQNMYMNYCSDAVEEEAESITDNILRGIFDFNKGMSAFEQDGVETVIEIIEEHLMGKSNSEKYTTYCNATVAIKTMDQKVFSKLLGSEKFQTEEALEELFYSGVECQVFVTDEMVEEVQQLMITSLESSVISLNDIERLKNIPEEDAEEYIREFAVEEWSSEERKAYLSLAAYLAYRDGKLFQDKEKDEAAVNPYYWAVAIAANVEAEGTLHNALQGNITWEKAAFTIQTIGYVVFALAVMIANTAIMLLVLGLMIETASIFSFILTGLIGFGLICAVVFLEGLLEDFYYDGCKFVKEYAEDNYERVLEGIKNVYQYVKSKIIAGYITISENNSSNELKTKRLSANN